MPNNSILRPHQEAPSMGVEAAAVARDMVVMARWAARQLEYGMACTPAEMADELNAVADRLEALIPPLPAALAGQRCPQSAPHGPLARDAVTALVNANRIRSEVYMHNWRVAVILVGTNRGKSTAPPPAGGKPYLVNGVHVGRIQRSVGRIAP